MRRWSRRVLVIAAVIATVLQFSSGVAGAVPEPGASRALWGGTEGLQAREGSLGRPLDLVRVYTQWVSGPPAVNATQLSALVAGGTRTLLISASIPWESWRSEGQRRNSDADATNNVTMPWCKFTPRNPTTGQASGKTWFQAVGDGDYDGPVRTWLQQLAAVANGTPALYVTFHHEPERLSDDANSQYQGCVGTPAQYRAAYDRVVKVAQGVVGTPKPDLTRRTGTGPLVFVPIYTAWGFWHTAGTPTSPSRALVTPSTGQPLPGGSADDLSLRSARVTAWVPSAEDYDDLAVDVFNFSGSSAASVPTNVRVDDPSTTTRETDQWWSLEVLMRPVRLWTDNWGALPNG